VGRPRPHRVPSRLATRGRRSLHQPVALRVVTTGELPSSRAVASLDESVAPTAVNESHLVGATMIDADVTLLPGGQDVTLSAGTHSAQNTAGDQSGRDS
jgi:hypothetical protein